VAPFSQISGVDSTPRLLHGRGAGAAGAALRNFTRWIEKRPPKNLFDAASGRCYGSLGISLAYRVERQAKGSTGMAAFATPVTAPVETVDGAGSQRRKRPLPRIRERIVSLTCLPVGRQRGPASIGAEIGRTPIREALQRLARENLVRSIAPRHVRHRCQHHDLARITEVRVVLEDTPPGWLGHCPAQTGRL